MASSSEKKSKKEYLHDIRNILRAVKKTIAFSFRVSPTNTLGIVILTALTSLIPFVVTWVNSRIIDQLISDIRLGGVISQALTVLIVAALSLFVIRSLLSTVEDYFRVNQFFDFSREFEQVVNRKFAYLDVEYYESPETNTLITKVWESYGGRPLSFMTATFRIFSILVSLVSSVVILLMYSPMLVLLLVVVTSPRLFTNLIFGRRKWHIWDTEGDTRRDWSWTKYKLSNYTALQEIRIFGVVEYLLNRVNALYVKFQEEQKTVENRRNLTLGLLDLLRAGGYAISFLWILKDTLKQVISVGDFNFYTSTMVRLQSGFLDLFRDLASIYEHGLFVVDIFAFLDLEEKVIPGTTILAKSETPPVLEFRNVTFRYPGTRVNILKNFDLTIEPGEHLAIVGENGAGKTTLIKLLMRFYDVNKGEILIDGVNVKEIMPESWYEKVGALFQEFNTYHFDAKTNIGFGDISGLNDMKRIRAAARKSGADSFIRKYDLGYEQILDRAFKNGIRPSWGQWQRIALARAFFKDAPVLILDEPTSAIDPKAEFKIFDKLFKFSEGKSVVIISHRFSTVRNAKRIIVLDKGKIIEDGSHDDLMNIKKGVYRNAFELQRRGYV